MTLLLSVAASCRSDRGIIAGDKVTHASAAPGVCGSGAAGVRWMHAPSTDRARLDGWCAGVGPAVTWSPAITPAVTSAQSIAVLSWNTNVGSADIAGLVRDLRAGKFTKGAPVPHFVLLLQEVHRAGDDVPRSAALRPRRIASLRAGAVRQDITQLARELGLSLLYVPSMANGWDVDGPAEDRGNAILSTVPLHDATAIELPHEGQRRVVAAATLTGVDAGGDPWQLRVVNVHLDNRSALRSWRAWRSFGAGRARQAKALVRVLSSDPASSLPAILGGDLNTWGPRSLERAAPVLREHFPHGQAESLPTYVGRLAGWAPTLDHLMLRVRANTPSPAVHVRRLASAHGSDHFPLIVQFSVSILHSHDGVSHGNRFSTRRLLWCVVTSASTKNDIDRMFGGGSVALVLLFGTRHGPNNTGSRCDYRWLGIANHLSLLETMCDSECRERCL